MQQSRMAAALAAVRDAVRAELDQLIHSALELDDESVVDIIGLTDAVLDEIASSLDRGDVDDERVRQIARVHHRVGIEFDLVTRIYVLLQQTLVERGFGEAALLVVAHERALGRWMRALAEERLEARDALERAIVELANSFADLVGLLEQDAIERICELVVRVTGLPLVFWAEAEGTPRGGLGSGVVVRAAAGVATPYALGLALSTDERLPAGQGPVGRALRTGRVTVSRVPEDPQFALWRTMADAWGLGSALVAPVSISMHRSGAIALYRPQGAELPDDVEDIAAALGHELSRLFRARAMARLERRRRALDEVRAAILQSTEASAREFFAKVTASLVGCGAVDRAAFYEHAGRRDGLEVLRLVHVEAEDDVRRELEVVEVVLDPARAAEAPLIAAAVHRERVLTAGVAASWAGLRLDRTAGRLAHGQVVVRYPVLSQGELTGVVMVSVADEQHEPLTDALFDQLGDVIAAAGARLERNQGLRTTEAVAQVSRSLLDASAAVVAAGAPEDVQEAVLRALANSGVIAGAWMSRWDPRAGASEVVRALRVAPGAATALAHALGSSQGVVVDALGRARDLASGQLIRVEPGAGTAVTDCGWRHAVLVAVPTTAATEGPYDMLGVGLAHAGIDELRLASVIGTGAQLLGLGMAEVALRDRLDQERALQQRLAQTDTLTGLMNRAAFEARLTALVAEEPVAVGFLDLDGFKDVNDSLGHTKGDELLSALGRALARLAAPDVLVARLGGDEFAVALVGSARHRLDQVAERISVMVRTIGQRWRITGSIGWALAPDDVRTARELLMAADEALYAAKAAGKARWVRYGGDVSLRVQRRRRVREGLVDALSSGEANFACQPKVDARLGSVVGVELLLRWPEIATVDVVAELRAAPELARSLGRAALRTGAEYSRRLDRVPVAVNITPSHFLHGGFLDDVDELVPRGAPLVVEITEDVALEDLELAAAQVAAVRARQIAVSLDDFGTAASSLSALARLQVDEVKVDRSFVQRAREDHHAFSVLAALATLEETGSVSVVAEGVEVDDEIGLWLRLGGSRVQGYRYARPGSVTSVQALIQSNRLQPIDIPRWRIDDLIVLSTLAAAERRRGISAREKVALEHWFEGPGRLYSDAPAWGEARAALWRGRGLTGGLVHAFGELRTVIDRSRQAEGHSLPSAPGAVIVSGGPGLSGT